MDNTWEQEKLEASKLLAVGAARRTRLGGAAVPSVQCITLALGQCQGYPGALAGRCVSPLLALSRLYCSYSTL